MAIAALVPGRGGPKGRGLTCIPSQASQVPAARAGGQPLSRQLQQILQGLALPLAGGGHWALEAVAHRRGCSHTQFWRLGWLWQPHGLLCETLKEAGEPESVCGLHSCHHLEGPWGVCPSQSHLGSLSPLPLSAGISALAGAMPGDFVSTKGAPDLLASSKLFRAGKCRFQTPIHRPVRFLGPITGRLYQSGVGPGIILNSPES